MSKRKKRKLRRARWRKLSEIAMLALKSRSTDPTFHILQTSEEPLRSPPVGFKYLQETADALDDWK